MSVPLVSVVIPTFNRGYCIERTIKSVIQQTFSDWEIIVVDNYSSDETDELLKNFIGNKIKLLKINNNGIVGKSRNLGISVAQGKYVAFLDSDDWWLPTKLENSLNELRKGARLVYHDMIINYESPNLLKRSRYIRSRHLGEKVFTDLLSNGNTFCNSSVVVERKLLLAVSNISECEKLVGSEDYDLWLRITANFKILFIDKPLIIKYGGHSDQLSKSVNGIEAYRIKSLENLLSNTRLIKDYKRLAIEMLITKLRIYKKGLLKRQKSNELLKVNRKIKFWKNKLIEY